MKCQSRCLTCNIHRLYQETPELAEAELTTSEWESVFEHLGKSYLFITYSGGEPCLRDDLLQLLQLSIQYGKPKYIAIPSNGLMPVTVYKVLKSFLALCPKDVEVHFNLSLDGINEDHDRMRGVPNGFSTILDTLLRLFALKQEYRQLIISVHTVLSKFNVKSKPIHRILKYFKAQPLPVIDSFISEIAEERHELKTIGEDLTPSLEDYAFAVQPLLQSKASFKMKLRNRYYWDTMKYLWNRKQPIPCMAGRASAHITAWGQVVSCCTRWLPEGYMGDLRLANYDINKVWNSRSAKQVRKSIADRECACPLANAYYSSLTCNPPALLRAII